MAKAHDDFSVIHPLSGKVKNMQCKIFMHVNVMHVMTFLFFERKKCETQTIEIKMMHDVYAKKDNFMGMKVQMLMLKECIFVRICKFRCLCMRNGNAGHEC